MRTKKKRRGELVSRAEATARTGEQQNLISPCIYIACALQVYTVFTGPYQTCCMLQTNLPIQKYEEDKAASFLLVVMDFCSICLQRYEA